MITPINMKEVLLKAAGQVPSLVVLVVVVWMFLGSLDALRQDLREIVSQVISVTENNTKVMTKLESQIQELRNENQFKQRNYSQNP